MSVYCEYCNVTTSDKRLANAHNKTKKHLDKVTEIEKRKKEEQQKQFTCQQCSITFASRFSLNRHILNCKVMIHQQMVESQNKLLQEKDNLIREKDFLHKEQVIEKDAEHKVEVMSVKLTYMEKALNEKDNTLKQAMQTVDVLTKENQFHKELVVGMKSFDEKSLSALSFVVHNYNNAPCLTYSDNAFSSLVDTEVAINTLINHFNKNTLHILIANAFVKEYKKLKPEDQSLWSTDVSRVNFLVREFAKELDKNIWIVDKKGNRITAVTLTPLMNYIILTLDKNLKIYRTTLLEYNKKMDNGIKLSNKDEMDNFDLLQKVSQVEELKIKLKDLTFIEEVLKKITSYFYCSKDENKKVDKKIENKSAAEITYKNKKVNKQ